VFLRARAQRVDELVQRRQQHVLARLPEHQRVGEVVDVFRGAGEVHELERGRQLGIVVQALLDVVLHGLHVVVGGALDFLDALGRLDVETVHQGVQPLQGNLLERLELGDAGFGGQRLEPLDFHLHAGADQAEFGEDRPQRIDLLGIAAIERGQGQQAVFGHRISLRGPAHFTRPGL